MSCPLNLGQNSALKRFRVLILEGNVKTPPAVTSNQPYSNRVCALSLGTVQFLRSMYDLKYDKANHIIITTGIGVWSDIRSVRAKPFKSIYVS